MFNLAQYFASLAEANLRSKVVAEDDKSPIVEGDKNLIVEPQAAIDRRRMLQGAGAFLGGAGILAALAAPAPAQQNGEPSINGLWQSVVSGGGVTFTAFEIYGANLWIGCGQTDLLPSGYSSSLWAVFSQIGPLQYKGVGRFWNYSWTPPNSPTAAGFYQYNQITTLSQDGNAYHGVSEFTLFDNNGEVVPGGSFPGTDDGVRIA